MTDSALIPPEYQCHKKVRALKIKSIERIDPSDSGLHGEKDEYQIFFEERPLLVIVVNGEWVFKHEPKVGGYYVVYEDGYASYSPAKAFEQGYSALPTVQPDIAELLKQLDGWPVGISVTTLWAIREKLREFDKVRGWCDAFFAACVSLDKVIPVRAPDGVDPSTWDNPARIRAAVKEIVELRERVQSLRDSALERSERR